ncbi:uncharacterized protein LOC114540188 [Dendronephthya gigantea]|uniref:uncharacterized protein LOC114540188 n=1 Tax=Dendronephthya gigantea TaxID=151771 RepID=UPI001068F31D|nr:uncharacterized protein LOC114540188 [Dendronephthya gigantea]
MCDDKNDENPFSFKHFVKHKNEDLDYQDKRLPNKQAGTNVSNVSNVQNDELPFPEVSETTGTKKKGKGRDAKKSSHIKEKPPESSSNLELDVENPFSFKNFVKKDAALKTGGRVLQIVDDEVCEVETNADTIQDITSEHSSNICIENDSSKDDLGPNSEEIIQLREENEMLKKQLLDMKKSKEGESRGIKVNLPLEKYELT